MAQLLVSVRSPQEAEAALLDGVGILDVKDPAHGSLGRADDATLAAVMKTVAGRRPVSAALGELVEHCPGFPQRGLRYAKWGLAGCGSRPGWMDEWAAASVQLRRIDPGCQPVAVAYADWRRAAAPPPEAVLALAQVHRCGAVLVDTWQKDGTTLLEWLEIAALAQLCAAAHRAGLLIALAGSLSVAQIRSLRILDPDWFAVRGAVCKDGRREQPIDRSAVQRLAQLLKEPLPPAIELHTPEFR